MTSHSCWSLASAPAVAWRWVSVGRSANGTPNMIARSNDLANALVFGRPLRRGIHREPIPIRRTAASSCDRNNFRIWLKENPYIFSLTAIESLNEYVIPFVEAIARSYGFTVVRRKSVRYASRIVGSSQDQPHSRLRGHTPGLM